MEPKVSIIIPIYNGEKYIDECMKCMKKQTYKNIEIILVDDGSKDCSGRMCDDYAKEDDRIKVCHQENGGLSSARNLGICNATGKYVWFFDVDDAVEPTVIEDNVKLAEANQADVVMFGFWYYDVDKQELIPNELRSSFVGNAEEYFHDFLVHTIEHEVFNAPWNKMIRKELLERNNLWFDKRYPIYEDIIFAASLLNIAQKVVVNNKLYYKYFVRSSGSLITRFYDTFFECVTQFHDNAMEYCSKYEDNAEQIKRFDLLYVTHVYTHLKQISCREQLNNQQKYALIQKIVDSDKLQSAIKNAELKGRKKIIRMLIQKRMCKTICLFYYMLGWVQRKNG